MTWVKDKRWSDRFLPEIKRILGEYLIAEPPVEEDAERNTDLMVLRLDAVRIGCRVRKYKYHQNYGGEFTIRAGRPSGIKTEMQKIIEGWGDYFFYGFSDPCENSLHAWTLADLKVFRYWYCSKLKMLDAGKLPGTGKTNPDGSSSFRAYRWIDFPAEFVIAHSPGDAIQEAASG